LSSGTKTGGRGEACKNRRRATPIKKGKRAFLEQCGKRWPEEKNLGGGGVGIFLIVVGREGEGFRETAL